MIPSISFMKLYSHKTEFLKITLFLDTNAVCPHNTGCLRGNVSQSKHFECQLFGNLPKKLSSLLSRAKNRVRPTTTDRTIRLFLSVSLFCVVFSAASVSFPCLPCQLFIQSNEPRITRLCLFIFNYIFPLC